MATINTVDRLAVRHLIQRAQEVNKEADLVIRITRVCEAFRINADQPLFNLIVQQQLMADDISSRLAEIEQQGERLGAATSDIQAAVELFEAQRAALFANDRVRTLLGLYWPWLALAGWFFTMVGFLGGMIVRG